MLGLKLNHVSKRGHWRYVHTQRQDNVGMHVLKACGWLFSCQVTKAELLSKRFSSVFTKEDKSDVTRLINDLNIDTECIEKLLSGLNLSKTSRPDEIPCRLLKKISHELAPVLTSISELNLPTVWTKVLVTQSFIMAAGVNLKIKGLFP